MRSSRILPARDNAANRASDPFAQLWRDARFPVHSRLPIYACSPPVGNTSRSGLEFPLRVTSTPSAGPRNDG